MKLSHILIISFLISSICTFLVNVQRCEADLLLNTDTNTVDFGTMTREDLVTGYKELTQSSSSYALKLSVSDSGPVNWTVRTKADSPFFTSMSSSKNCGDLQWRLNGNGFYNSYTMMDKTVASGIGDDTIDLDFDLITRWTDSPGVYSITVIYTITQDI